MAAETIAQSAYSGDESSLVYEAHPLNVSDSTNIRLLSVDPFLPEDDPETIRLNIKVFPFNDPPPYIALSYVWGQDPPSKVVVLDEHPVMVRPNLWDFLLRVRHKKAFTYLWIDALCIDQSSIAERNHQVAIMGPIYTRADRVIAWLGANQPTLVEACHRIMRADRSGLIIDGYFNVYRERAFGRELLTDLQTLAHAEYWGRMWTIQEFALAKEISVWCGHYATIPTAALQVYRSIRPEEEPLRSDKAALLRVWKYTSMRESSQEESMRAKCDLNDLLERCSRSPGQCSDMKDRIFSILSLAMGENFAKFPVNVDYDQSTSGLFFSLTKRRFRQLDDGSSDNWQVLSLGYFTATLANYMEIKSDQRVTQLISVMHELRRQSLELRENCSSNSNSGKHVDMWSEIRALLSSF